MKKNSKSIFDRKDLKVLSKKERRDIKGGNTSSGSSSTQTQTTDIVIEEIIQI